MNKARKMQITLIWKPREDFQNDYLVAQMLEETIVNTLKMVEVPAAAFATPVKE